MKTFKSLPGAHVVLTKMLQVWCYVWFPSQPSQDVRVGQTYETIHQKIKKIKRFTTKCAPTDRETYFSSRLCSF